MDFLCQVMRAWSRGGPSWVRTGPMMSSPRPKRAPWRYIDKQRVHGGIIVMVIVGTIDEADELLKGRSSVRAVDHLVV